MLMEETNNNVKKTYTDPVTGKFVQGNPGGGRPKGTFSLKTQIIQRLQDNPQETKAIIDYLIHNERALLFQMIDGRPPQDVTSGGETIKVVPIYGGISTHDSDDKDIQPQEENQSS